MVVYILREWAFVLQWLILLFLQAPGPLIISSPLVLLFFCYRPLPQGQSSYQLPSLLFYARLPWNPPTSSIYGLSCKTRLCSSIPSVRAHPKTGFQGAPYSWGELGFHHSMTRSWSLTCRWNSWCKTSKSHYSFVLHFWDVPKGWLSSWLLGNVGGMKYSVVAN